MKKISTILIALLVTFNLTFSQSSHIINTNGMSFSPDTIICNIGDTIIFNLGGYHNAVEVSSSTWIGNGTASNGGFSFPLGTTNGTMVIDAIKTYYYVCTPHVTMGMKALIISNYTDCNGVVNGSSIMDSCGVCQQSYIYDYVTHAVTMLNDTMNITLGPTEILVMANDPQNPYWNSSCTNTIYDIVSNSTDHTTLKTAIDTCALDGVLSGAGPFTLFAPTDAAFNNLPAGTLTALLNDIPALTDILKHHVVADSVMSSMLSNNQIVTTLLGTDITITINGGNVYINNAMVTVADLIADNGVVHVIDVVLIPSTASNSIYDIVANSPSHTTLKTAIDACALDGILSAPGPFTLFAPTDAAFNNLPTGTLTALLNDIPALTDILKHHVVADSVMAGMLSNNQTVTSLNGTDVTVTISNSMVYIDNALVTFADLIADNGVVHVIDAVLLPATSSIQGNIVNNGRLLKITNLLGQDANINEKQILLFIYENGIIEKRTVIK